MSLLRVTCAFCVVGVNWGRAAPPFHPHFYSRQAVILRKALHALCAGPIRRKLVSRPPSMRRTYSVSGLYTLYETYFVYPVSVSPNSELLLPFDSSTLVPRASCRFTRGDVRVLRGGESWGGGAAPGAPPPRPQLSHSLRVTKPSEGLTPNPSPEERGTFSLSEIICFHKVAAYKNANISVIRMGPLSSGEGGE